ncbi:hypothetical protein PVAND_006992 [Polypedilum vanderplanki]|uniref:MADF domain-containing protein n=1 Tax=Polypedilum vanderplanki TaxID=319348 RepID=A0A9J6C5V7_POLVA|nr:hypothetical protein PVAND_006992 [Polypedilum vanderplanki]
MSSLAAFANLDVDKLIQDIAARPAIWDKNFNGRQNKGYLEDLWEELAQMHNAPKKIIKAKWKGLRDNFRIQWKMIPRNENDDLMVAPEDFTGTKWQYYRPLLFLADNMGKSRSSYHSMIDDSSYELLQQFEPAIEIPSDDELEKDQKPEISPKLHQRLLEKRQRESSSPPSSPVTIQNNQKPEKGIKLPPKLRAIPHLNLMDIHNLISRSTGGETTISPLNLNAASVQQQQQQQSQLASSSNPSNASSHPKRRRTDEVTTTGCGASSNDEFPSESGNFPTSSNDDDYHFLMSLQPYLTQFTGPQKLRIRMRIQRLIFKELYQDIELDE